MGRRPGLDKAPRLHVTLRWPVIFYDDVFISYNRLTEFRSVVSIVPVSELILLYLGHFSTLLGWIVTVELVDVTISRGIGVPQTEDNIGTDCFSLRTSRLLRTIKVRDLPPLSWVWIENIISVSVISFLNTNLELVGNICERFITTDTYPRISDGHYFVSNLKCL